MRKEINVNTIPDELIENNQWVSWQYQDNGGNKSKKVPLIPSDRGRANVSNPQTWTSFQAALAVGTAKNIDDIDGIGFVFSNDDPYIGVDLDDCVDDSGPDDWAEDIIDQADSYTEYSPSGTGVHIILEDKLPDGRKRNGDVEMYGSGRFFTVTGHHIEDTPSTVKASQNSIEAIYAEYLDKNKSQKSSATKTHESRSFELTDDELLEKAKNANNGEKFRQLWNGDTSRYKSHSEADLALCRFLAFWTGENQRRMNRLFCQSGLYREKWDSVHSSEGDTYGEMTVTKAVNSNDAVY